MWLPVEQGESSHIAPPPEEERESGLASLLSPRRQRIQEERSHA